MLSKSKTCTRLTSFVMVVSEAMHTEDWRVYWVA